MLVSTARREILKPGGDEFMAKTSSIRVLLVDDHAMFRQGLRCALEVYPNIEVVGQAGDGQQAVECVAKVQPTVVVMDINMSKMDGIAATRLIKAQHPHCRGRTLSRAQGLHVVFHAEGRSVQLYAVIQLACCWPILY
jgi:DNA-binding NarL/FixJ family response regulator